ncbi:MAG: hypothetical protein AB1486_11785 [Planctomycetota bacterium]
MLKPYWVHPQAKDEVLNLIGENPAMLERGLTVLEMDVPLLEGVKLDLLAVDGEGRPVGVLAGDSDEDLLLLRCLDTLRAWNLVGHLMQRIYCGEGFSFDQPLRLVLLAQRFSPRLRELLELTRAARVDLREYRIVSVEGRRLPVLIDVRPQAPLTQAPLFPGQLPPSHLSPGHSSSGLFSPGAGPRPIPPEQPLQGAPAAEERPASPGPCRTPVAGRELAPGDLSAPNLAPSSPSSPGFTGAPVGSSPSHPFQAVPGAAVPGAPPESPPVSSAYAPGATEGPRPREANLSPTQEPRVSRTPRPRSRPTPAPAPPAQAPTSPGLVAPVLPGPAEHRLLEEARGKILRIGENIDEERVGNHLLFRVAGAPLASLELRPEGLVGRLLTGAPLMARRADSSKRHPPDLTGGGVERETGGGDATMGTASATPDDPGDEVRLGDSRALNAFLNRAFRHYFRIAAPHLTTLAVEGVE